ncbi:MAG: aspartate-semialdehyde dehydrogenase, partial [Halobacteriales archaeon]|nr:aspartate-semialdehyde dehydrogenase [Halobacteriales archaeon]
MKRIPVAVLGATGAVGQRFISLLAHHPWFETKVLVGSESAGARFGDTAWMLDEPMPEAAAALGVVRLDEARLPQQVGVVFSALPGGVAGPIERRLATAGCKVFTNARDHRMDARVPLVIPEVNADHLALLDGGPGWIVANGNCTAIVLTMALAPLHGTFGLDEVHVTSMQALSGAGYPGVSALDIADNVLPFIAGEEEKLETEPNKTLGTLAKGKV